MNKNRLAVTLLFLLVHVSRAWSDTVTTIDQLSVNGSLTKMMDGVITLEARFPSGTKTIEIKMAAVDTIEFNSTTFNPGAPPKVLGIGPPQDGNTPLAESNAKDMIVLHGNERKGCHLLTIDAADVHCKESNAVYSRRAVLRILVGSQ